MNQYNNYPEKNPFDRYNTNKNTPTKDELSQLERELRDKKEEYFKSKLEELNDSKERIKRVKDLIKLSPKYNLRIKTLKSSNQADYSTKINYFGGMGF